MNRTKCCRRSGTLCRRASVYDCRSAGRNALSFSVGALDTSSPRASLRTRRAHNGSATTDTATTVTAPPYAALHRTPSGAGRRSPRLADRATRRARGLRDAAGGYTQPYYRRLAHY